MLGWCQARRRSFAVYGEATGSLLGKRTSEQEIKSELRELTERVRTLRQELEAMTGRGGRLQGRSVPVPPRRRPSDKSRTR